MCRNTAPAIQCSEQAVDGALQDRGAVAHVTGFSERLVDHRVKRDGSPNEFAPLRLRVRQLRATQRQHAGKPACDLCRQTGERQSQPSAAAAKISPGQHDTGARNSDADLAGAPDRQKENVCIRPAGCTEVVGGDDYRGVARECRRVGSEVAEQRADESADAAPEGEQ